MTDSENNSFNLFSYRRSEKDYFNKVVNTGSISGVIVEAQRPTPLLLESRRT